MPEVRDIDQEKLEGYPVSGGIVMAILHDGSKRRYSKGKSETYAFFTGDNIHISECGADFPHLCNIPCADMLEIMMNILERSEIKLTKKQVKNLKLTLLEG
jgi:hypothetical protein